MFEWIVTIHTTHGDHDFVAQGRSRIEAVAGVAGRPEFVQYFMGLDYVKLSIKVRRMLTR